jgi:hypothetical protein
VVGREPERLLGVRIALDLDVAGAPALGPGRLVLLHQAAPAEPLRALERHPRAISGIRTVGIAARKGDQPQETHDLSGAGAPVPGP